MTTNKKRNTKVEEYKQHRRALRTPKLSATHVDQARAGLRRLAVVLCEYVWGKSFH